MLGGLHVTGSAEGCLGCVLRCLASFDCSPLLPYAQRGELCELFVLIDTQSAVGAGITTGYLNEGWLDRYPA